MRPCFKQKQNLPNAKTRFLPINLFLPLCTEARDSKVSRKGSDITLSPPTGPNSDHRTPLEKMGMSALPPSFRQASLAKAFLLVFSTEIKSASRLASLRLSYLDLPGVYPLAPQARGGTLITVGESMCPSLHLGPGISHGHFCSFFHSAPK